MSGAAGAASGAGIHTVKVTSDGNGAFYLPDGRPGSSGSVGVDFRTNFFTIRSGDSIRWRAYLEGIGFGDSGQGHNLRLSEAPRGVRGKKLRQLKNSFKFPTDGSISNTIDFSRRFTLPGRYVFICTEHTPGMRMGVKVNK